MTPPPRTSVITIVHGRVAHLEQLLAGLARCRPAADELVVVDMGSEPPASDVLDGWGSPIPVRMVRLELTADRLPLAEARNAGAAAATGDRLVFLDVDCIPAPDLVSAYREAPGEALACAPVRYLRAGWRDLADDLDVEHLLAASDAHHHRPAPLVDHADDRYELFWSLSFAVDRDIWTRLGGFDERFVGYGAEDTDLAFTARHLAIPLVWLASGTAFHQWHESLSPPIDHLVDIVANAQVFFDKWGIWPMGGWLRAFADRGLIEWTPEVGTVTLSPGVQDGT